MKATAIFLFLFYLTISCFLQSPVQAQDNGTVRKLKRVGTTQVHHKQWNEALEVYQLLDSIQPNNATTLFNLGKCTYHVVDKPASLLFFLKAYNLGLQENELLYYLGKAYQFNYDAPNALSYLHLYSSRIDSLTAKGKAEKKHVLELIEQINKAKDLLNYKLSVAIENLGEGINSNTPDYVPISLSNDSVLIFTSRRPGSIGGKIAIDGIHHEDVYISHLRENGEWSSPTHIPDFNEAHHDASVAISHDEKTLYLYKAKHNGDIFFTTKNGSRWTKPKPMSDINTKYWEGSVALSPTGDTLLFSSDRPGGYGGSDIYIAIKDASGKWSNIKNMGPTINSSLDDDAPYIYKDGKTLFFSSKGHNSIGGYDVFTATLKSDSSLKVTNLGFPINTMDDDIYFQLNSTAAYGYFTSNRYSNFKHRSIGEKDLFQIKRPNSSPTNFIFKGLLGGSDSLVAIPAVVVLTDLSDPQNPPIKIIVDINSGQFRTDLKFDNHYELRVEIGDKVYHSQRLFYPYQPNLFESFLKIHLSRIPEFQVKLRDVIGRAEVPNEELSLESAPPLQSIVLIRSVPVHDTELNELLASARVPVSFQQKLSEQIEKSDKIDHVDRNELKETLSDKWPEGLPAMTRQIAKMEPSKIESIVTPTVIGEKKSECNGFESLGDYERNLIERLKNVVADTNDVDLFATDIAFFQSLKPDEFECFYAILINELKKSNEGTGDSTVNSILHLKKGLEKIQDKLKGSSNFTKLMRNHTWGKLYTINGSHFDDARNQDITFKGKIVWRSNQKAVRGERLLLTNNEGLILESTTTNESGTITFNNLKSGQFYHILINDYAISLTGQSRYELIIESIETTDADFRKFYDSLSFVERRIADRITARKILADAYSQDPIAREEDVQRLAKLSPHQRSLLEKLKKYLNARTSNDSASFLDKQAYYDYLQTEFSEKDNFNRQIARQVSLDIADSAFYARLNPHQRRSMKALQQYRESRKQLIDQVALNENESNYWYTMGSIDTSSDTLPPYVTVHAKISGDPTDDIFKVALIDDSQKVHFVANADSSGTFSIHHVPLNKKYHVIATNGKNLLNPQNYKLTDLRLEGGEMDFYNSLSATEKRRIDRRIALEIAETQYVGNSNLLEQDINRYQKLPGELKDYIKRIAKHLLADTVTFENTNLSGSDNYQYYSVLSSKDREFINRLATRIIASGGDLQSILLSEKDQKFFKKILPHQQRQLNTLKDKRRAETDIIGESPSLIVDRAWQFIKFIDSDSVQTVVNSMSLSGRLFDATVGEYKVYTPIMITDKKNNVIKILSTDSTGYFNAVDVSARNGFNILAETSQFLLNQRNLIIEWVGSGLATKDSTCVITFEFDSYNLTESSKKKIIHFFQNKKKRHFSRIQIFGHTDQAGSTGYNQRLGLLRAEKTRAFLETIGINYTNIYVFSYGETLPVPTVQSGKNELHRRVEISVDMINLRN